jgi:hypothetical protein
MLAIVISGLFPPWIYTYYRTGTADTSGMRSEKSAGYHFILTPPPPEHDFPAYGVKFDMGRLLVEWVCILAASGAAWGVVRLNRERISEATKNPTDL